MIGANYDYILVTLDGASLQNKASQRLVGTNREVSTFSA